MNKNFDRAERVASRIREELAGALLRKINDPRISGVTVTAVKVTRDIRLARIYYTVAGGEQEKKAAAEGFAHARGFLKRELAATLLLRYMPDLDFLYDKAIEHARHVDEVLASLKKEGGL
ncbi:MAG: 30S ribosome-binding factor RbfA [Thermodesulfobacteriota bacterium]